MVLTTTVTVAWGGGLLRGSHRWHFCVPCVTPLPFFFFHGCLQRGGGGGGGGVGGMRYDVSHKRAVVGAFCEETFGSVISVSREGRVITWDIKTGAQVCRVGECSGVCTRGQTKREIKGGGVIPRQSRVVCLCWQRGG